MYQMKQSSVNLCFGRDRATQRQMDVVHVCHEAHVLQISINRS